MKSLNALYDQFENLCSSYSSNDLDDFSTDLLQNGVKQDYFEKVENASGLLREFYDKYLTDEAIFATVFDKLQDQRKENVKFCLLIDVLRCYDGMDHPTSFTTPEGIALMVLIGKMLNIHSIDNYNQLAAVSSGTLSLIDLIPYLRDCSDELGNKYSLFLSQIIVQTKPNIDKLYRLLMYELCKRIAEVDGEISISEQEWLNEIALLNDDDPNNDIDADNLIL